MIRVILSWIPHDRYHPIVDFIYQTTEPILSPFRDIIPSWKVRIDLSPLFAFFAIRMLEKFVYFILR